MSLSTGLVLSLYEALAATIHIHLDGTTPRGTVTVADLRIHSSNPAALYALGQRLLDCAEQLADETAAASGAVDDKPRHEGPNPDDVTALTALFDLMQTFPSDEQRARYLLTSNWMRERGAAAARHNADDLAALRATMNATGVSA